MSRAEDTSQRPTDLPPTPVTTRLGRLVRSPVPYLLAAVVLFAAGFTYLTFLRLDSFHSSINDLGAFNQVYWITLHGGPNSWQATQSATFYSSYPWQSLVFVVMLPAYAAFPDPHTLLVGQGIAVPLAALPIYLLARRYRFSPWMSFGFAGLYLLNYQVESAALNDYHLQVFFPVLFFSMVLAYEARWKWAFVVLAFLAMTVNPLTLGVVLAFLVAQMVRSGRLRRSWASLARTLRSLANPRSAEPYVLALGIALFAFEVASGSIAGYHVGVSSTQGGAPHYSATVETRLVFLAMTFLPFLGVAFLTWESLLTAIPLLAFLGVADPSYFHFVGHQDAFEYLTVGLWGLMVFSRDRWLPYWEARRAAPPSRFRSRRARAWGRAPGLLGVAVAVTAVLFAAFSPLAPGTSQRGYLGTINELPGQFAGPSTADRFLAQTIALVPSNASVLTQNNVVQLTGRPAFNWAFPGKPGTIRPLNYTYIIADDSSDSVAQFWYAYLEPYVTAASQSGAFGVFSIGYGILGLEQGFHGPPLLLGPTFFPARSLPLYSGHLQGNVAIHPAANDFSFWYGPYLSLPAGNFTVTFQLMVTNVTSASATILALAVYNWTGGSVHPYREVGLTASAFGAVGVWEYLRLNFTLPVAASHLEFGGLFPSQVATIYFAGETLTVDRLT